MEINTKLIKLESQGYRYLFSSIWILYSFTQLIKYYQLYYEYLLDYPDRAESYLVGTYLYLITIVVFIVFVIFFMYIDHTVKNKNKFLILKDNTLFIPTSLSKKIKKIKLEDIDNIGLEGFYQEKIKINMKTSEFIIAPRVYNTFVMDIKDIYNKLNELLVIRSSKIE